MFSGSILWSLPRSFEEKDHFFSMTSNESFCSPPWRKNNFINFSRSSSAIAEMMLINNAKKCSLKRNGGCWQVFKITYFFSTYQQKPKWYWEAAQTETVQEATETKEETKKDKWGFMLLFIHRLVFLAKSSFLASSFNSEMTSAVEMWKIVHFITTFSSGWTVCHFLVIGIDHVT